MTQGLAHVEVSTRMSSITRTHTYHRYDYALASDFGRVLARIPTLSEEAAAVVWTMVDRRDEESALAPYWRCGY